MKRGSRQNMDDLAYRTAYLVAGFLRGTLTPKEHDELDEWIGESDENMKLFEDLTDESTLKNNHDWITRLDTAESYHHIKRATLARSSKSKTIILAIAAVVLLICGIFFVYQQSTSTSTNNITQNNYRATEMDTIHTSDGKQNNFQLSDGTKIWMNSSSTLSFPKRFADTLRLVYLNGEAYFEVAKDPRRPFRVIAGKNISVEVLGTRFNIQSYHADSAISVSLLEGSITVEHNGKETLLPGEQYRLTDNGHEKLLLTDTSALLGWKNVQFHFRDTPLRAAMNEIGRWYHKEIVYSGPVTAQLNATIPRGETLNRVLQLLELTNRLRFKVDSSHIYISPVP